MGPGQPWQVTDALGAFRDLRWPRTHLRSAGAEAAGEPRAEPMSRPDYADYMRRGSGADSGDDTGGRDDAPFSGTPEDGGDSRWTGTAGQAQGMTRGEYADHMRQGPAAEEEWPSSEERARLHETYLDWREEAAAGRSPGDQRDLPPTGEELLESETGEHSRLDALREWEKTTYSTVSTAKSSKTPITSSRFWKCIRRKGIRSR